MGTPARRTSGKSENPPAYASAFGGRFRVWIPQDVKLFAERSGCASRIGMLSWPPFDERR